MGFIGRNARALRCSAENILKPSITIDERGVLLHVTTDAGEGIAIKLEPATVLELVAQLERARALFTSPAGRKRVARGLGQLVLNLLKSEEK